MKNLKILVLFFIFYPFLVAFSNPFGSKQTTQKPPTKEIKKKKSPKIKLSFEENLSKKYKIVRLKLDAIVSDFAFLNQKWVQVGDFVSGFEVKSIEDKTIVLNKNNETIKLGIGDEFRD